MYMRFGILGGFWRELDFEGILTERVASFLREIIVYSQSTINVCSLISHEWWVPLIKFMVGPTIHVRGGSTHLWYSGST